MEWIKCSERIPNDRERVLVINFEAVFPRPVIADYADWSRFAWHKTKGITHWMPLPPPPSE